MTSRLTIRLISNFQSSPTKVCQAFVISSNQCGSFRPIRSDSLFSNINFALPTEKIATFSTQIHLIENIDYPPKNSLIEHYLSTYNPLQLDFTEEQLTNQIDIPSKNHSHSYPIGRYVRLQEEEKCSAIISVVDDRLSECSTKLSNLTIPMIMVTDCCNGERLHTDIIEIDEENESDLK